MSGRECILNHFNYEESVFGPHHRAFDLFGDGSVIEVWVPGHGAGLSATLIRSYNSDQYVLLAADAGYARRSWEENLTPGVVINRQEAEKSLLWVKQKAGEENNIATLANHDPEVPAGIITL